MNHTLDFLGDWTLESFYATGPDGQVVYPLGEVVVGRISYDRNGRMAVQIMSQNRPPFSKDDFKGAPPEEIVAAFVSFISYCGTYAVDANAGQVTHHLEIASVPNWVGTNLVRYFEFDEETLTLRTPPIVVDGTPVESVLRWHRD